MNAFKKEKNRQENKTKTHHGKLLGDFEMIWIYLPGNKKSTNM